LGYYTQHATYKEIWKETTGIFVLRSILLMTICYKAIRSVIINECCVFLARLQQRQVHDKTGGCQHCRWWQLHMHCLEWTRLYQSYGHCRRCPWVILEWIIIEFFYAHTNKHARIYIWTLYTYMTLTIKAVGSRLMLHWTKKTKVFLYKDHFAPFWLASPVPLLHPIPLFRPPRPNPFCPPHHSTPRHHVTFASLVYIRVLTGAARDVTCLLTMHWTNAYRTGEWRGALKWAKSRF